MYLIKKENGKTLSINSKLLKPNQMKAAMSPLAWKIVKSLSESPNYPKELGRQFKLHEQKIYYHINKLEKSGLIEVIKTENKQGAIAKYYTVSSNSFAVKLKEFEESHELLSSRKEQIEFLEPFIVKGKLNATIIVGSPDPHGPEKARARDGYYGIDLALFLGTFLGFAPQSSVKLDTEIRESELKNNLVIIGGPVVNRITGEVNDHLPIKFDQNNNWNVVSKLSGNEYAMEETGIIVKAKNPYNKDTQILVVAGKRYSGTKAAIIAFSQNFDKLCKGNIYSPRTIAKVVEGIDLDSDGIVDSVEFRE